MTTVHPLSVYQKARSDVLARNDLSKNSVTEIQEKARIERMNGELFIQHISTLPFSVILFSEENFKILHNALKISNNIQGHLDATGGIVRRVSQNSLLNHCLVFPIKSNSANNTHCVIVLAELITEDNCSYNIENFLRLVKSKYQLLFKNEKMLRSIVTDKSYANINAIIQSQNRLTLLEYLEKMYEGRFDRSKINDITFVFLCSSHLAKIWLSDIRKWFKHMDNEEIYFLCSIIGNAVNICRYKDLKTYLENLFTLFLKKKADYDYEHMLLKLKEAISEDENWIHQINSSAPEVCEIIDSQSSNLIDLDSKNVIYKQSKFYKEFDEFIKNLKPDEDRECKEENVFYCPEFINHFLKNSVAILPLWSAVYFSIDCCNGDQFRRPNNGYVEGHFSSIKNKFRTDLAWGKLGTIKIGRYVEAIKQQSNITCKEINLSIPNKHVSRKQKDSELTILNISAQREKWRGK